MMLNVNVSTLIKKRKEKNFSQYKLSLISGLPGNAVYRMELGNHKVNLLRAQLIAQSLNCNVEDIFYTSK